VPTRMMRRMRWRAGNIMRQPLGVVGCIVSWNYPLMMAAWKLGPALAGGTPRC